MSGVTSQLSVEVAVPVLEGSVLSLHWMVTSVGQVIDGGVLSVTVIIWLQVFIFPQASVDFQVLVIKYFCGHDPVVITSLKVIIGEPSQLSVEVAEPVFAGRVLSVHWRVTSAGQVITGSILSLTKMVWLQVFIFPQASVLFHVRVIVYRCGQEPAAVTSEKVIVGVASQLSVDVAVPVAGGNVLAVHWIVTLDGQLITGATLSLTTIVWTQALVCPQSSVVCQVLVIV